MRFGKFWPRGIKRVIICRHLTSAEVIRRHLTSPDTSQHNRDIRTETHDRDDRDVRLTSDPRFDLRHVKEVGRIKNRRVSSFRVTVSFIEADNFLAPAAISLEKRSYLNLMQCFMHRNCLHRIYMNITEHKCIKCSY